MSLSSSLSRFGRRLVSGGGRLLQPIRPLHTGTVDGKPVWGLAAHITKSEEDAISMQEQNFQRKGRGIGGRVDGCYAVDVRAKDIYEELARVHKNVVFYYFLQPVQRTTTPAAGPNESLIATDEYSTDKAQMIVKDGHEGVEILVVARSHDGEIATVNEGGHALALSIIRQEEGDDDR
jgi:hypothetical protein